MKPNHTKGICLLNFKTEMYLNSTLFLSLTLNMLWYGLCLHILYLVHLLSCVQLFVTSWTAACQASLSITSSQSLPKLMSIELAMPSNQRMRSSSVVPFSSCPRSLPVSGSFQMSQLFASGGQSIGISALTSVPPVNTQDWSTLGWTGWISSQPKGLSWVLSNTTVQKHQFFGTQQALYSPTLTSIHDHWKNHILD